MNNLKYIFHHKTKLISKTTHQQLYKDTIPYNNVALWQRSLSVDESIWMTVKFSNLGLAIK